MVYIQDMIKKSKKLISPDSALGSSSHRTKIYRAVHNHPRVLLGSCLLLLFVAGFFGYRYMEGQFFAAAGGERTLGIPQLSEELKQARSLTLDAQKLSLYKSQAVSQKRSATAIKSIDAQYIEVLKQRHALIKELLDTGKTEEVIEYILSPNYFASVPKPATAYIEKTENLSGTTTLRLIHGHGGEVDEDGAHLHSTTKSSTWLLEKSGVQQEVYLTQEPDESLINKNVTGEQLIKLGSDYIAHTEQLKLAAQQPAAPAAKAPTDRTALAVIVNIEGSTSPAYKVSDVRRAVFGTTYPSANGLFKEASFGKVGIKGIRSPVGDVAEPISVKNKTGKCDSGGWTADARAAVAQQGIDVTQYNSIIFFMNNGGVLGCNAGGDAFVQNFEAKNTNIRIYSYGASKLADSETHPEKRKEAEEYLTHVIVHELGHTYGLYHASSLPCKDNGEPIMFKSEDICNSNYSGDEYGDVYDPMGSADIKHISAFYKARLGFLTPQQVKTVDTSATYALATSSSMSANPNEVRLLRIPLENTNKWLYLDYRQNVGQYEHTTSPEESFNGIFVRLAGDYVSSYNSFLLDAQPDENHNFRDSAIKFGTTATLADGIKITPLSGTNGLSKVKVELPEGGKCYRAPQSILSLVTVPIGPVRPGQEITRTIKIRNSDSPRCPAKTFSTRVQTTDGLRATVSPTTPIVSLKPEEIHTVTVKVRSTKPLPEGGVNRVKVVIGPTEGDYNSGTLSSFLYYNIDPAHSNKGPVVTVTRRDFNAGTSKLDLVAIATGFSDIKRFELFLNGNKKPVYRVASGTINSTVNLAGTGLARGANKLNLVATDNDGRTASYEWTINTARTEY